MKTKLLIAHLSLAFVVSSFGYADTAPQVSGSTEASEIELRLNLAKGKNYEMRSESLMTYTHSPKGGDKMPIGESLTTTAHYFEVRDVLTSGNYVVSINSPKVKITGFMGPFKIDYDSETQNDSSPEANQIVSVLLKDIVQNAEMEVDQFGRAVKIIAGSSMDGGPLDADLLFTIFPESKVKLGDSWEFSREQKKPEIIIDSRICCSLIAVQDGIATIRFEAVLESRPGSDRKITGNQKGMIEVEIATGMAKKFNNNSEIDTEQTPEEGKMLFKMNAEAVVSER